MFWFCDGSGWNGKRSRWAVMNDQEKYIHETKNRLTNNEAEYLAAIAAGSLAEVKDTLVTDSQLVVNQVKGKFKVKKKNLVPYHKKLCELCMKKDLDILWTPRKENKAGKLLERIQGHWL